MRKEIRHNNRELLEYLAHLPRKMVRLQGIEQVPEFILHELCHEHCFNLSKAAFLVDNPDFNVVRGIAGFDHNQAFADVDHMWENPQGFIDHMSKASFNQQIKQYSHSSVVREGVSPETINAIARELGFQNPVYRSWVMKHDNHGFLIYEYAGTSLEGVEEHLDNSLYLLNFCPLF